MYLNLEVKTRNTIQIVDVVFCSYAVILNACNYLGMPERGNKMWMVYRHNGKTE